MHNLVQAEFFHAGRNENPDFKDFLHIAHERIGEIKSFARTGIKPSSRIKTVVRFYDVDGVLTSIALESQRLRSLDNKLTEDFLKASPPGRVMLGDLSKRLAGGMLAHKNICKIHAQAMLRQAIKLSHPIAVEKLDHTFRLAQKNELHEILEAVSGSSSAWLFVFEPNVLFSIDNKSVAIAF